MNFLKSHISENVNLFKADSFTTLAGFFFSTLKFLTAPNSLCQFLSDHSATLFQFEHVFPRLKLYLLMSVQVHQVIQVIFSDTVTSRATEPDLLAYFIPSLAHYHAMLPYCINMLYITALLYSIHAWRPSYCNLH